MAERFVGDLSARLILEVEKHPILYDRTRRDYVRKDLKDDIWRGIAARLGTTASEAQAKWRNIKDCMYKHYKKDRASNGQNLASLPSTYKHAHILGYLIEAFDKLSNMNNPEASGWEECSNADTETIVLHDSYTVQALPTTVGEAINGTSADEGEWRPPALPTWEASATSAAIASTPAVPSKKRRRQERARSEDLAEGVATVNRNPKELDEMDMFLGSMSTVIRKLPTKVRSQVKFSIHKIVHEAEMKYMYPASPERADGTDGQAE